MHSKTAILMLQLVFMGHETPRKKVYGSSGFTPVKLPGDGEASGNVGSQASAPPSTPLVNYTHYYYDFPSHLF